MAQGSKKLELTEGQPVETQPVETQPAAQTTVEEQTFYSGKLWTASYQDGRLKIVRRSDSAILVDQEMPIAEVQPFMAGFSAA